MHPMKNVEALVIDCKQLRGDVQRLARLGLSEMFDVILDGVVHASGFAVSLIHSDPAEKHIHRITEYLAVTEVRHMTVIIHPFRSYHTVQHSERLTRLDRLR